MTDPIADLLTRIRNANSVRHEVVEVPSSNVKKAIANILLQEGYIKEIEEYNDGVVPMMRISLKYGANKERVITGIKRISKPGLRVYCKKDEVPSISDFCRMDSVPVPERTEYGFHILPDQKEKCGPIWFTLVQKTCK